MHRQGSVGKVGELFPRTRLGPVGAPAPALPPPRDCIARTQQAARRAAPHPTAAIDSGRTNALAPQAQAREVGSGKREAEQGRRRRVVAGSTTAAARDAPGRLGATPPLAPALAVRMGTHRPAPGPRNPPLTDALREPGP